MNSIEKENDSRSNLPVVSGGPELSLVGLTIKQVEFMVIQQTLIANNGNKAKSARMLGISEKSIYNKMKRLGIQPDLKSSMQSSDEEQ